MKKSVGRNVKFPSKRGMELGYTRKNQGRGGGGA